MATQRTGKEPEATAGGQAKKAAASTVEHTQRALEEAVFRLVEDGVRRTGCRNLCLAGGVAMNSKANGRLLAKGLVDDVFVQPAATDDGTAIGAAVAAHPALGAPPPRYRMTDAYLGPEFDDEEIASVLDTYKLRATHAW